MSSGPGGEPPALVRPYAMTGGRTRAAHQLAIEALVLTTQLGRGSGSALIPEYRRICRVCREARSVAEVAALLQVPLGVARVLIGDLLDDGLVAVHQSALADGRPAPALLERVLGGLRRL